MVGPEGGLASWYKNKAEAGAAVHRKGGAANADGKKDTYQPGSSFRFGARMVASGSRRGGVGNRRGHVDESGGDRGEGDIGDQDGARGHVPRQQIQRVESQRSREAGAQECRSGREGQLVLASRSQEQQGPVGAFSAMLDGEEEGETARDVRGSRVVPNDVSGFSVRVKRRPVRPA